MKKSNASRSGNKGVIILAAGQGKRMRSALPKVLHQIGGRSLIHHVLRHVHEAVPGAPIALVVGYQKELVEEVIRKDEFLSGLDITFIYQLEQKGTGHAARFAMDSAWGDARIKEKASILVLPGDLPLITTALVSQMFQPLSRGEMVRLLTCELTDPTGYGRVVRRGKQGGVIRIVEQKDANQRELLIREVGASIYLFEAGFLRVGLKKLSNKNAQGEYYLTDLISQAATGKRKIDVLSWPEEQDLRGVNDPWELALAGKILNERLVRQWALKGVKFLDPWSVQLGESVDLAEDVVVDSGVILSGATRVGQGTVLGPHVILRNVEIGARAVIKAGTIAEDSIIGSEAQVGPYAHLRPESKVGRKAKIGNFVELKKTTIGEKTSVAHLSYLGDADVGAGANIGCGFVTCNFDGRVINGQRKHKTVIEDEVFMGSDCQAIAPIRIGKGAYVASGSTLTRDVPAGDLAIARSKQENKTGYAARFRPSAEKGN